MCVDGEALANTGNYACLKATCQAARELCTSAGMDLHSNESLRDVAFVQAYIKAHPIALAAVKERVIYIITQNPDDVYIDRIDSPFYSIDFSVLYEVAYKAAKEYLA
jgi:hypothetical protein